MNRALIAIAAIALGVVCLSSVAPPERDAQAMRAVNSGGIGAHVGTQIAKWRVELLLANGQSLSTGYAGACQSNTQPFSNTSVFALDAGDYNWIDSGPYSSPQFSFVPLDCSAHGIRTNAPGNASLTYPANVGGESLDMTANEWTSLKLGEGFGRFVVNASGCGIAGQAIGSLIKNASPPYNAYQCLIGDSRFATELTRVSISAAVVGSPTLVTSAGHSLVTGNNVYVTGSTGMTELNGYYPATVIDSSHFTLPVASSHSYTGGGSFTSAGVEFLFYSQGETDAYFAVSAASWTASLQGMLANLRTDVPAFTGQTELPQLIVGQQNSSTLFGYATPLSNSTAEAVRLMIGTANTYVAGAQYADPPSTGPHMNGQGYEWRNEKYAEAADSVQRTGNWLPLDRTGKVVTGGGLNVAVNMSGGIGDIVIDHALLAPHQSGVLSLWSGALGFEAYDITTLHITAMTGNGVSPISVTYGGQSLSAQGVATNDVMCFVGDLLGNTAANGCFVVTVNSDTNLSLNGTTGNGTWTGSFLAERDVVLLPISSATITGSRQVSLVLGRAAVTHLGIGYADTPDVGGTLQSCAVGGACGLIHDSDPFRGISGTGPADAGASSSNPNYLLAFENLSIAGGVRGASPILGMLAIIPIALRRRRSANDGDRVAA